MRSGKGCLMRCASCRIWCCESLVIGGDNGSMIESEERTCCFDFGSILIHSCNVDL